MEGTNKEQPNLRQHHSVEAYNHYRGDIAAEYRIDLAACRSLSCDAAARCRADARAQRAESRAELRHDLYAGTRMYRRYDPIEQGFAR